MSCAGSGNSVLYGGLPPPTRTNRHLLIAGSSMENCGPSGRIFGPAACNAPLWPSMLPEPGSFSLEVSQVLSLNKGKPVSHQARPGKVGFPHRRWPRVRRPLWVGTTPLDLNPAKVRSSSRSTGSRHSACGPLKPKNSRKAEWAYRTFVRQAGTRCHSFLREGQSAKKD